MEYRGAHRVVLTFEALKNIHPYDEAPTSIHNGSDGGEGKHCHGAVWPVLDGASQNQCIP